MTTGDEETTAAAGEAAGGAPRPRLQRTTTLLAYRAEPLAVAQQHAAEAAMSAAATPRPSVGHPPGRLPSVAEGHEGPRGAAATAAAADAAADQEAANAWAVGGTCDPKYWENPGGLGCSLLASPARVVVRGTRPLATPQHARVHPRAPVSARPARRRLRLQDPRSRLLGGQEEDAGVAADVRAGEPAGRVPGGAAAPSVQQPEWNQPLRSASPGERCPFLFLGTRFLFSNCFLNLKLFSQFETVF